MIDSIKMLSTSFIKTLSLGKTMESRGTYNSYVHSSPRMANNKFSPTKLQKNFV